MRLKLLPQGFCKAAPAFLPLGSAPSTFVPYAGPRGLQETPLDSPQQLQVPQHGTKIRGEACHQPEGPARDAAIIAYDATTLVAANARYASPDAHVSQPHAKSLSAPVALHFHCPFLGLGLS